jgi:hypothetical protein
MHLSKRLACPAAAFYVTLSILAAQDTPPISDALPAPPPPILYGHRADNSGVMFVVEA